MMGQLRAMPSAECAGSPICGGRPAPRGRGCLPQQPLLLLLLLLVCAGAPSTVAFGQMVAGET